MRVFHLVERGRVRETDLIERETAVDEVRVRVVEAGDDRAAFGVDRQGLRAAEAQNLAVRPDADDLVAAHRDRLGQVGGTVARIDLAVDHDQIHRAIVFALRANDQTGDESNPDNECHGISRKAGRHR